MPRGALGPLSRLYCALVRKDREDALVWVRRSEAREHHVRGVSALAVFAKLLLQRGLRTREIRERIALFQEGHFARLYAMAKAAATLRVRRRMGHRHGPRERGFPGGVVELGRQRNLMENGGLRPLLAQVYRARCDHDGARRTTSAVPGTSAPGDVLRALEERCPAPSAGVSEPRRLARRMASSEVVAPASAGVPWSPLARSSVPADVPQQSDPQREAVLWAEWTQACKKALLSQSPRAAPGPSGMRPCHLTAFTAARGGRVELHIAQHADMVVAGMAQAWMAAVVVVPVPKPDGGIRPIGMGEVATRMAGRLVASSVKGRLSEDLLARHQYVLADNGTARIHDKVQAEVSDDGRALLCIDLANAFNSLNRDEACRVIEQLDDRHGEVRPYCRFQYAAPAPTWAMHAAPSSELAQCPDLPSGRGVVQGEAMASSIFAAAVTSLSDGVRESLDDAQSRDLRAFWYADDGYVTASDTATLRSFLVAFTARAAEVGLAVNTAKCSLLPPRAEACNASDPVPGPDCPPVRDVVDVVGGPVAAACLPDARRAELHEEALIRHAERVADFVRSFVGLADPQAVLYALQRAGSFSRVQSRASLGLPYPLQAIDALEKADMDVFFNGVLGRAPESIDASQRDRIWCIATCPVRSGGLGITSVSQGVQQASMAPAVRRGELTRVQADAARRRFRRDQVSATLAVLRPFLTPPDVQRMTEATLPGASAWVMRPPSARAGTLIKGAALARAALGLRVTLLPGGVFEATPCPHCAAARPSSPPPLDAPASHPPRSPPPVMGPMLAHATVCPHRFGSRHDAVRDAIAVQLRTPLFEGGDGSPTGTIRCEVGLADALLGVGGSASQAPAAQTATQTVLNLPGARSVGRSPSPRAPSPDGRRNREADVYFHDADSHVFADITVVGWHHSFHEVALRRLARPASALKEAWNRKLRSANCARVRQAGCAFVPLAFSAFGGLHGPSWKKLCKLGGLVQDASPLKLPWGGVPVAARAREAAQVALLVDLAQAALLAAAPAVRSAPAASLPPAGHTPADLRCFYDALTRGPHARWLPGYPLHGREEGLAEISSSLADRPGSLTPDDGAMDLPLHLERILGPAVPPPAARPLDQPPLLPSSFVSPSLTPAVPATRTARAPPARPPVPPARRPPALPPRSLAPVAQLVPATRRGVGAVTAAPPSTAPCVEAQSQPGAVVELDSASAGAAVLPLSPAPTILDGPPSGRASVATSRSLDAPSPPVSPEAPVPPPPPRGGVRPAMSGHARPVRTDSWRVLPRHPRAGGWPSDEDAFGMRAVARALVAAACLGDAPPGASRRAYVGSMNQVAAQEAAAYYHARAEPNGWLSPGEDACAGWRTVLDGVRGTESYGVLRGRLRHPLALAARRLPREVAEADTPSVTVWFDSVPVLLHFALLFGFGRNNTDHSPQARFLEEAGREHYAARPPCPGGCWRPRRRVPSSPAGAPAPASAPLLRGGADVPDSVSPWAAPLLLAVGGLLRDPSDSSFLGDLRRVHAAGYAAFVVHCALQRAPVVRAGLPPPPSPPATLDDLVDGVLEVVRQRGQASALLRACEHSGGPGRSWTYVDAATQEAVLGIGVLADQMADVQGTSDPRLRWPRTWISFAHEAARCRPRLGALARPPGGAGAPAGGGGTAPSSATSSACATDTDCPSTPPPGSLSPSFSHGSSSSSSASEGRGPLPVGEAALRRRWREDCQEVANEAEGRRLLGRVGPAPASGLGAHLHRAAEVLDGASVRSASVREGRREPALVVPRASGSCGGGAVPPAVGGLSSLGALSTLPPSGSVPSGQPRSLSRPGGSGRGRGGRGASRRGGRGSRRP